MIRKLEKIDLYLSELILDKIKNKTLDRVLSRINRGESLLIILLISFYFHEVANYYYLVLNIAIVTYLTDRLVLFIKKTIARKRPLIRVMNNQDKNPDMKHSFPSAHAANSMVTIFILVTVYHYSPLFFAFSIFAGIGRLISLHHFLSDILGGWLTGITMGLLNLGILYFIGTL